MNLLLALMLATAHAAPAKKAPAIPEEARRAFVKGNTAFADAKDPDGFRKAASRYEEAMKLAPKWPEPVFNLAKAREAAHDYSGALSAVNSYLKLGISEADKRQAKDWSYTLEEKAESKGKEAAENAALDRFIGTWASSVFSGGAKHRLSFTVTRDGKTVKLGGMMFDTPRPPSKIEVVGDELRFDLNYVSNRPEGPFVTATGDYVGRLSADGRRMNFTQVLRPYTPEQRAHWDMYNANPGSAFGTQDWLKE